MEQIILALAIANGFYPSPGVVPAIAEASLQYNVNPLHLTAIAIVETGLGKYGTNHKNANGTTDVGLFQINSINHARCIPYDLTTNAGSAMCAAKLLSKLRDIGAYHSKTPKKKMLYNRKIASTMNKLNIGEIK